MKKKKKKNYKHNKLRSTSLNLVLLPLSPQDKLRSDCMLYYSVFKRKIFRIWSVQQLLLLLLLRLAHATYATVEFEEPDIHCDA